MEREFYECNQIAFLHMFRRISKQEIGVTWSGKRYRVDIRKRPHGQDSKTFIKSDYSPLLSEFENEESLPDKPQVTPSI